MGGKLAKEVTRLTGYGYRRDDARLRWYGECGIALTATVPSPVMVSLTVKSAIVASVRQGCYKEAMHEQWVTGHIRAIVVVTMAGLIALAVALLGPDKFGALVFVLGLFVGLPVLVFLAICQVLR